VARFAPWRRLFGAALVVLASEQQARAEGDSEPDEVVVFGSAASSGFVSKASVDDAPREITDASSLLESVPGVHVQRLGGDDSFATLSIRGSASSEVAVLFAGVPMTGAADPSLDLATLPLWPGARIRVYRSFAPSAFGPGSLGGTLVLEPPRTSDPERTETWGAVGSFGEARMRAADVRAVGDGRVVTALSASRADDDFSFFDAVPGNGCATGKTPAAGCYDPRLNNGHAAVNGLVAWAIPFGSGGTLAVTTLLQARRQELPGDITLPTPFASLTSNRELSSIELTQAAGPGAWSLRGWARRDELSQDNKPTPMTLTIPAHSVDIIDAVGVSGGWRGRPVPRLTIEGRADGSVEGNEPGITVGGSEAVPRATRLSAGAGVDADWHAASVWKLGASARLDVNSDDVDGGTSTSGPQVRPTGHIGSEVSVGPVVLAAHGGAVARPASFVELYGSPGGILPNPSLVGESAWTVDAGAHAISARGPVRGQAEISVFGTWAHELILFVPQGEAGYLKAENIGQARIYGLEASLAGAGFGFDVRAAYTGLMTINDDADAAGAPLPGRPAHDFSGDLGYSLGPARVRYGVDAIAGIHTDNIGFIPVPSRVIQGVGARLDVPGVRGLRIAFEIRNLFDVRSGTYPGFAGPQVLPIGDQYGYPLPGRSLLVTARWTSSPTPEIRTSR
jgi:vitamin B12 transporter